MSREIKKRRTASAGTKRREKEEKRREEAEKVVEEKKRRVEEMAREREREERRLVLVPVMTHLLLVERLGIPLEEEREERMKEETRNKAASLIQMCWRRHFMVFFCS